jgi:hypothetical protein
MCLIVLSRNVGRNCWLSFQGLCSEKKCRRFLTATGGVFCTNFSSRRGTFAPCEGAWCGPRYKLSGTKDFPVQQHFDEAREKLEETNGANRFLEAYAGDHLMTSFQCDSCHFRNIMGCNPLRHWGKDAELLAFFRRANLGSFWAHETSTVQNNLREAKRIEDFAKDMGMPPVCPPMGPFPLEDTCGMRVAAGILNRSLDKGKFAEHVQFETFRKARLAVTNVSQAGVSGLTSSVGAYERNKMWISNVPTHSFWFSRFMHGIHRRVGEIRKQDEPITVEVLKAVDEVLERDWRRANGLQQKRRI